ncbi:MAG: phosphatidate cytidylyltransferase [Clostridia bacterium]
MVPSYLWLGLTGILPVILLVVILNMFVIALRKHPIWTDAASSLYAVLTVLLPLMLMLPMIRIMPEIKGALIVFSVFLIALFGDMFAFFAGVTMGKHKLNPELSPNKTWEGAVTLCMVGSRWTAMPPVWHFALIGLLGGMAGQLGDLSASLVKRWCGVKDFGVVFPGHGGVMDRFDSILFTTFVVYSYCALCIL